MLTHNFDFSKGEQGWVAGFADYDPTETDRYQFRHDFRDRPESVGLGGSLYISGMNRSDDLFMFHKRKITGLGLNVAYKITFSVALASRYVSKIGSGGDPAKSVHLKACVSTVEPKLVWSEQALRLDIDIGRQSHPGKNSVLLGNIEKPHNGTDEYALISRQSSKSLAGTSAQDGSLWLLFGTDSGYEGETALYYTAFEAVFNQ